MSSVWNCRGKTISLDRARIMGILNLTPDSFSDGGRYTDGQSALRRAHTLVRQGADMIDVGGQSTRPGFTRLSADEEWARLADILPRICSECGVPVSVDTFYPQVAKNALDCGAAVINDVSGEYLDEMSALAAQSGCGYCLTCCADISSQSGDALQLVRELLLQGAHRMISAGVEPEQLMLDPSIGFGKTREQDRELILRAGECSVLGLPVLIGASRKRVIAQYWSGDVPPEQRDSATHVAHLAAVKAGAAFLRVHDVQGARKSIDEYYVKSR